MALLAGPPRAAAQQPAGEAPVAEAVRARVEQLRVRGTLVLAGDTLEPDPRLAELYEARAFRPLWGERAARDLRAFVQGLWADGLDPARYHLAGISAVVPDTDHEARAALDLLRTAALLRVAHDLRQGRVHPGDLDPGWRVHAAEDPLTAAALEALATAPDPASALAGLRPRHALYELMRGALARYRTLAAAGGWPTLPARTFLARDSVSEAVRVLRRRLAVEGDLPADAGASSSRFDEVLERAVKAFQHRHGLNEDGVVGSRTLAELNTSAAERAAQLTLNLERARWVMRELADTFVAVNIAGQRAYALRGGEAVWESRVVVGRTYTRTPIFRAPMRYVVLNPTWTVPRSINGEILANIRRDSTYLARLGFEVLDGGGAPVDPASIDFSGFSGGTFPWTFRQRPGPANSLGTIKFMLPNELNVYLHDTPARELFRLEERAFSHGCIRLEDPLGLAEVVLPGWDRRRLADAVASGRTLTVDLPRPVPVFILYWTAAVDFDGTVHFYRDVYGRDPGLEAALSGG